MLCSLRRCQSARPNRVSPRLNSFEDRIVPCATIYLTTLAAEATVNGAIIRQADAVPTDSGQFQTFVRLQDFGVELGYNTDARPVQFDTFSDPAVTHSLQLGEIPTVTVDGVVYREFLLDINETASRPFLSLDQLKIFVGETGDLRGYSCWTGKLAGLSAVFDLDGARNVSVAFNANLNRGTGTGDAVVLIPDAVFAGYEDTDFVYLFSRFGARFGANGGFEQWGVRPVEPPPPPPQSASLSGFVYLDDGVGPEAIGKDNGVRDDGETGLAGVVIQLLVLNEATGQYDQVGSTTTDANGFYHFDNLQAGVTYALAEETPVGSFIDGADSIGTQGGSQENDFFFGIALTAGQTGVENNFGEHAG
jgi:SdrD B-like domain